MFRITAKTDGFRRCGVAHSGQPTDHPADRFTKGEIEILKAEPMLTVVEIEDATKNAKESSGNGTPEPLRPNAPDTIAKIKEAASIEMLDELAKDEDRKSVLAAIEARRKELSA